MALDMTEVTQEIEAQRPRYPAGLLSRQEKDRLIERGLVGLYRWYTARSQTTRNWNPDQSFNWRALHTNHSSELNRIIEGYFAVEQYVPDYVSKVLDLVRTSHGRSHFQIRWGSEEEKHSDTWLNAVLFLRHRTPEWIEAYKNNLRSKVWRLPYDEPLHMAFYAVIQERATQINYLNTARVAQGKSDKAEFANDQDPILAEVAQTIAVDEAAHYAFYVEVARLFLYYYPARALEALADVVQTFAMPAMDIIPNFQEFYEAVYRTGVYGSARTYARDVLQAALETLGVAGRRALIEGVKRFRQVPDQDGNLRDTAVMDTLDYGSVQTMVRQLFGRIEEYEREVGFAEIDPTRFVSSGLNASGA